ncbi:charged multivesicular body protein 4b-like isoform X2 [Tachypleus tridentatus]
MSLLAKLFGGGKSKQNTPTPAEAIQRLRGIEDVLIKKQDYLEKKIEQEIQTAKKNGSKNKRIALQALKRKKRYEKQLTQIDGTLTTIEFQREALENANTNTEVLKVMGLAAKALKNTHEMDIDDVQNLMDEVQEQQEVANEISEAISNPVGFGHDVDDDDLLKELEDLEEEELDQQLLNIAEPSTEKLPNLPQAEPSRPRKAKVHHEENEDEMKELAAWAS